MQLITDEIRRALPRLNANKSTAPGDIMIHARFFTPDSSWTWWIAEFDGDDTLFGFVEGFEAEWGTISLAELSSASGPMGLPVERDLHFKPGPIGRHLPDRFTPSEPAPAAAPAPPPPALRAYNDHAAVECSGIAADRDLIVLLDIAGHKSACKSVWASIVSSPRKLISISGGPRRIIAGGGDAKVDRYQQRWQDLPQVSAVNCLINHVRLIDPLARKAGSGAATQSPSLTPFYVVGASQAQAEVRLAHMLNAALELPILESWSAYLYTSLLSASLITPIQCGGDVTVAFKVVPDEARVREVLAAGLSSGQITL